MKKILCIIDGIGAGGAQRQMVGLATFLKQKGYNVEVIFYLDYFFYENVLKEHDVPYLYLQKTGNNLHLIHQISQHIRKSKPDVVISYLAVPSIAACVARLFNRSFQLIVSERNTTQQTTLFERFRFTIFKIARYVVPNAFAQEQYIRKMFPSLAKKVVTIPNFVDLNHFVPSAEKKRHAIPEIIVVATIWPSKNTLGFIDALVQLKEKGYSFHVSWYGLNRESVDYISKCKDKIDSYNIHDYIELKEKTNQIRERYQEADYFCLPSFYEGTPNVICEAIACGLPVFCSNVCDNSLYVNEGYNGCLFDPKDTESIVAAFQKLIQLTDQEYREFCRRSREIAEQKLSKDRFVSDYIKLIEH